MSKARRHRKEYEVVIQLPGRGIVGTKRVVFDPEHPPFRSDFTVTRKSRKLSGGKDWFQVWKANPLAAAWLGNPKRPIYQAFCLVCAGGGKFLGRPGSKKSAEMEATSHMNMYGHSVTILEAK